MFLFFCWIFYSDRFIGQFSTCGLKKLKKHF
jgi:hypothetical protein